VQLRLAVYTLIQFDFEQAIADYGAKPITGLIHVGACTGEERDLYLRMRIPAVLWIEANPATYVTLSNRILHLSTHQAVCALISDRDGEEVSFYVTTDNRTPNDGRHASSSMLPLAKHRSHYPNIYVTEVLTLPTRTLASVLPEIPIAAKCNAMVLDIQGAELRAMMGAGDWLDQLDYICTEVNIDELYAGCGRLPEVEGFLNARGFKRVLTQIEPQQWGDALFIK